MLLFLLLAVFLFLVHTGAILRAQEKTMVYGGTIRRYRVHIPSKYDPATPSALVIALHGLGDHPRLMELYTGLSVKADNQNFIVVYPYGTKGKKRLSWNGLFCCGSALRGQTDDLGFLVALINQLKTEYTINPRRVFMTGYSNGAIMAYRFASEHPEIVRATAIVQGSMGGKVAADLPYQQIATPMRTVPLLVIHGKHDHIIPYHGGRANDPDSIFLSVDSSVALWVNRVPNVRRFSVLTANKTVELTEYTQYGKVILRHLAPLYSGHVWGGLMDLYDMIWRRPHFFATDEVVAFFKMFH